MKTIGILLAVLGLSVAALVTSGQEPADVPESPPPAAAPTDTQAAEPAETPAEAPAEDASADAPRGASGDVFIPTVEVQADEEIVFPVDI